MSIYYNQFLDNFEKNPTSIDNGLLINNICYINQESKPTTRPDGSALGNDLWYNPSTGKTGFYNNSYWLNTQFYLNAQTVSNISATGAYTATQIYPLNTSMFIETMTILYGANLTADSSNYWTIQTDLASAFGAYNSTAGKKLETNKTSGTVEIITINTANTLTGGSLIRYQIGKTGSPTNLTANIHLKMREIL